MKKTVITLLAVSMLQISMVSAAFASDTITSGQSLVQGNSLQSADGRFALDMQSDGDLELYNGSSLLWSSGTTGDGWTFNPFTGLSNAYPADKLELTTTGVLAIRDATDQATYWQADTQSWINGYYHAPMVYPTYGDTLIVQDDGNLVLYDTHSSSSWLPVWATNTGGH